MSNVTPINPKVREALAALDAAPDDVVDTLGCWRSPTGTLAEPVTRQEWRDGLLTGDVDPAALLRTIRLLGFVASPAFDALLTAHDTQPGRTA
jgi:hypothetical protein